MDVAIVGLSPTAKDAPFNTGWEMWGMPWDSEFWPMYDRLFEMHDLKTINNYRNPEKHIERLKEIDVPLYMQEKYFDNVTPYPEVRINYFNSSVSYMIALAIEEGADRIGLWGIDMRSDSEYGYQKPNAEYLLGLAEGMGIEIVLPDECPLLKYNDIFNIFPLRYGLT